MAPLACCLLGIAGCGDAGTGPDEGDGEAIQTDRASYELVRRTLTIQGREYPYLEAEIGYTFTNQTGQSVYFVRCDDPVMIVERLEPDGSWVPFWGPGYNDCLAPAIVVAAGDQYTGTFPFAAAEAGVEGFSPTFPTLDFSGHFRLVLLEAIHLDDPSGYPDGVVVDQEYRVSNPFTATVR